MYMKSVPSIREHEGRYHRKMNCSETSDLYKLGCAVSKDAGKKRTPRRLLLALGIPENGRIRSLHKLLRGTLQTGL